VAGFGYAMNPSESVMAKPGEKAVVKCGLPLELRLKAGVISSPTAWQFLEGSSSEKRLHFEAQVVGAGGELYMGFYQLKNSHLSVQVSPPEFEVDNLNGAQLAGGTFENAVDGKYAAKWLLPSYVLHMDLMVEATLRLGDLVPNGQPLESKPVIVQPY
jgi:hypothetical protein